MPKQQKQKFGGNKAKSRQHTKHEGYYKQQFARTEKNRKRRLKKHLSLYPADQQALLALEKRMNT